VYYVQVDGGSPHAVARRSDGQIVVFGVIQRGEDRIPELLPGTSYVDIDARYNQTITRVGPTSTYVAIATGCAGSTRAARLVPRDTPRIGATLEVNLFDLPASAAFLCMGWSTTAPQPLDAIGMPGCAVHITADAAVFLAGQQNTATWQLPIPNDPNFVGARFYNQAVVLDPSANPAGAVISDAAEAVIGHW
jgi:hypothetical protein